MRKLMLAALASITIVACTKKSTTTNTYVIYQEKPHYTVNGVHDATIVNGSFSGVQLPLEVLWNDSTQEKVTLSVTGLPPGVSMDTRWTSAGIPTFTTILSLYDTSAGVTAGTTSTVTITTTSASFGTKTYNFNLSAVNATLATSSEIIFRNNNCSASCALLSYPDSITNDAAMANKIWIHNFGNAGISLYGWFDATTHSVYFPAQNVSGVTYTGSGHTLPGYSALNGTIKYGAASCDIHY